MDSQRFARLGELFEQARTAPPQDREQVLLAAAAEDAELGRELAALCAQLDAAPTGAVRLLEEAAIAEHRQRLDQIVAGGGADQGGGALPCERVGPYRLSRRIGQGGMGAVFEAWQESPRRRVALKLMHPTHGSPERLRRFQLEGEVLGRLQHPGIAQIHACGVADFGHGEQPWLAMEFVEGLDLLLHCERAQLDVKARLQLVAAIADAMQHAHDRGIVHRDLKPENVLVDGQGRPRVLDFGVARATDTSTLLATMLTHTGELIGTLAYMAPEQLGGDHAATSPRADVYALGVILYQLLAGRLPHDVAGLPLAAAVDILTHKEPLALERHDARCRGDVATIVHKAMQKEPQRRYESAAAFAADLRRHLADEPITARQTSAVYRLRKLVRRNRGLAASLVAVVVTLVAGLVATTWQAREAHAAASAARWQAYSANLVLADAELGRNRYAAARDLLASAPAELRGFEWRVLTTSLDGSVRRHPRSLPRRERAWIAPLQLVLEPGGKAYWTIDTAAGVAAHRWDLATGSMLGSLVLPANEDVLWKAILSPDCDVLRVVSFRGHQRQWGDFRSFEGDVATGVFRERTLEPPSPTNAREPSPAADGAIAWTWGGDGLLVDAAGVAQQAPVGPEWGAAYFDRSSDRLVWSDNAGTIRLATTSGRAWPLCQTGQSDLRHCAFEVGGQRLATCSSDTTVKVFEPSGEACICRMTLEHPLEVLQAAFAPDGEVLATLAVDRVVRVWDLRSGRLLEAFGDPELEPSALAFLGPREIGCLRVDGTLVVFRRDAASAHVLTGHTRPLRNAVVLPGVDLVVTGGWDGLQGDPGSLRLWDAASGESVGGAMAAGDFVYSVSVSHPPQHLAVGWMRDNKGSILVLDTATARVRCLDTAARTVEVALAPDGVTVFATSAENQLQRLSIDGATPAVTLRDLVFNFALSHAGTVLAVAQEVALLDAASGRQLRVLPSGYALGLAFSPDDRWLATGGSDCRVRVWDVASGREVAMREGHDLGIYALAFSPDGTRLASAGADQGIRLWDTANWAPAGRLSGHTEEVVSLHWCGERLVSSSGDQTARIWEPVPVRERVLARQARAAALVRVEPMVAAWFAADRDAERAMAAVDRAPDLDALERRVARQLVLARALDAATAQKR